MTTQQNLLKMAVEKLIAAYIRETEDDAKETAWSDTHASVEDFNAELEAADFSIQVHEVHFLGALTVLHYNRDLPEEAALIDLEVERQYDELLAEAV